MSKDAEKAERFARIDLRRAAVAYAEVAGDEDDDLWTEAWARLRDTALAYAEVAHAHAATRARAKILTTKNARVTK